MAFQLLLQSLVLLYQQLHLWGDLPASRGRAAVDVPCFRRRHRWDESEDKNQIVILFDKTVIVQLRLKHQEDRDPKLINPVRKTITDSGNVMASSLDLPGVLRVERWRRFRVEGFQVVSAIRGRCVRLKSQMVLSNLIGGYLWVARRRAEGGRPHVYIFA